MKITAHESQMVSLGATGECIIKATSDVSAQLAECATIELCHDGFAPIAARVVNVRQPPLELGVDDNLVTLRLATVR